MDSLSVIFINLIVLGVFGAIFFARGEVEKDLLHRQKISTDIVSNKMERLAEKLLEQEKSFKEIKTQMEAFDKRITGLASTVNSLNAAREGEENPVSDPLANFIKAGSENTAAN
jgi:uncharacterized protein YneF (UPF0154 family)